MASSLGHLAATVSLNIDPFKSSATALKAQIKSTTSALKAQEQAIKGSGSSLNSMKVAYSTMGSQMKNYEAQLERQKTAYQQLRSQTASTTAEQEKLTARQANAANQVNRTSANMESLRNRMSNLNKSITLQGSGWTQAGEKAAAFSGHMKNVGSSMSNIGGTMTSHVTTPIVAGFGYAISKSINFKNTMNEVKNLLVTSGESTSQAIRGVNEMEKDALTYSNKYGVSQQSIARGYEDLVKRGYSSKQALGAMKYELEAAKASGDDFNDVVQVSSQTLEAFGMKSNTTAGMTRNTKTAVNELAYAADATSTNFSDLGVGMSYVGSTAHQAGFGLAETSAAMGILSNNGLEADKAGTGLRKAIDSLISPTKNATGALKSIGLSTKDFVDKSGKMKSMTDIFGILNDHMKGLSQSQRLDLFHSIFGTTGQQAALILADNASQLGKLTQKVKESADGQGYVAKLSEKNMQSAKNQLEILKQSLTNVGMTMANDLIPALMPVIKDVDQAVVSFSHLSKGTQENIMKWGLLAAAAGPVLSILGKFVSLGGGAVGAFASVAKGIGRASSAAKLGGSGMDILKSAFSRTAYEAGGFAGAAGTAGGAATELGTAGGEAAAGVGLLNPVVLGVTATVVAGAAVWEIWGKKAYESQQRTNKWGSDVGQQADSALTKFQGFSSKAGSSLTDFEKAGQTSTKSVSKDFGNMYSEMKKDSKNSIDQMKKDMQGLPSSVQADLRKDIQQRQQYNAKVLADAKQNYTNAETILKQHNGKISSLSDTERAALLNDQQKMNADEINLLKISGSAKKNVLAALNGDISNMTRNQRNTTINELTSSMQKENKMYDDQKAKIDSMYSKGELSSKQYSQALKDLQTVHKSTTDGMAAAILKLDKANGASKSQIEQDLLNVGYTYKQAAAIVKQQNTNMANSTSLVVAGVSNMNGKVKTAAQAWNSLVFDPKTGKVKTNAQDEVNKAVQSKNQWNQIQLLERKGKMSSNAKAMVADALLQTGKWDSLSFKQQKAWIQTNAGTEIYKALSANGKWNTMSFAAKEAVINAKGLPQLANAIVKYNLWNDLPTKVKELLATDKTASATLKNAGINVDSYNSKNPKHKVLTGDSSNVDNASSKGKNSINSFNSTAPLGKRFQGNSSSVDSASSSGRSSVTRFRDTSPGGSKSLRARDNASGPASSARSAVLQFSWLGDHTVTLTTVKRTVHEVVNKVSSFFGNLFATGTEDAPEGMAVLGDGGRNEPYLTPSGSLGISPNVPTPYYLERGTRVWPSIQAFKQDIPHYANGTLGHNGAVNTLLEARPTINKMADTNVTFNSNNADVVAVLQQQMTLQKSQINLLSRLLNAATSPSSSVNSRNAIRSISQQLNSFNIDQKRGSLV
ncbi:phage tail tape measure protein [Liquorilactobacillus ghanensis]|uniref:phage tail tape measure protein n=1 Tax=Liquorilactobacillus ghanensis TaxID=399370 RepID=UPI0039ED3D0C